MFTPDLAQFRKLASKANIIPIWKEIAVDYDTPVSLFSKLGRNKYSFLLESLEGGEKWGRYSFIGLKPFLVFGSKGNKVFKETDHGRESFEVENPLATLREIMQGFSPAEVPGLPRFYGGAVGFLGYDAVRFIEKLPDETTDPAGFNDAVFMFPELLMVYDSLKHSLKIINCVQIDPSGDHESLYRAATVAVQDVVEHIKKGIDYPEPARESEPVTRLEPEVPREKFEAMVRRAKEYIRAGDIIQVVLSQRFSGRNNIPTFNLYRALRRINPSPYLYYLRLDDEVLIGSSPEILVRLTNGRIEVRPIAGTRPRGKTRQEDLELEKDLLADPKEKAEHLMLLDLGRNDVGRVARIGTVKVEDMMTIERYSHVMHIVTGVYGKLRQGLDMFDVFKACFPAGTVSGAPKIRAMEIIEELEDHRRGPYAGAVGYFGFSGNMDLAITIRTLCQKKDRLYLQAGAGIVADSDPSREWEETLNKGKALMRAIHEAQNNLYF
ncbi:MAG TPA: anthranilate synthase component I [Thermodesulfobacteriaceae bacterium]|nr:anthranilate synthase component I [Thermodesulfobacteriaceae bacterium]